MSLIVVYTTQTFTHYHHLLTIILYSLLIFASVLNSPFFQNTLILSLCLFKLLPILKCSVLIFHLEKFSHLPLRSNLVLFSSPLLLPHIRNVHLAFVIQIQTYKQVVYLCTLATWKTYFHFLQKSDYKCWLYFEAEVTEVYSALDETVPKD